MYHICNVLYNLEPFNTIPLYIRYLDIHNCNLSMTQLTKNQYSQNHLPPPTLMLLFSYLFGLI